MSFEPLTAPQDYFVLAGQRSPGVCDFVGADSPRRWDERRGYGLSGATVVFRGIGLSEFKARLRLYNSQDWSNWHAFRGLLQRPPTPTPSATSVQRPPRVVPRALDIQHPLLEDLGIRSVVVVNVLQPEQTGNGEWTIEIVFKEFRRPVVALSRPDASQERVTDPVDVVMEQLSGQFQELAGA